MLQITLTSRAAKGFQAELHSNGIDYQFRVRTTYYFLEDSPKLRMAVQEAKGRYGAASIKVTQLS